MADLNPVLLIVFCSSFTVHLPLSILPLSTLPLFPSHPFPSRLLQGTFFSDLSLWEPLEWDVRPTPVMPVAPHPGGT